MLLFSSKVLISTQTHISLKLFMLKELVGNGEQKCVRYLWAIAAVSELLWVHHRAPWLEYQYMKLDGFASHLVWIPVVLRGRLLLMLHPPPSWDVKMQVCNQISAKLIKLVWCLAVLINARKHANLQNSPLLHEHVSYYHLCSEVKLHRADEILCIKCYVNMLNLWIESFSSRRRNQWHYNTGTVGQVLRILLSVDISATQLIDVLDKP